MAKQVNKSFALSVAKQIATTQKRMDMVMKQSLSDLVKEVQTPEAKGGKMRVDTGFLRNSGQASLNGMPSGASVKPDNATKGEFDKGDVSLSKNIQLVIAQLKYGATFYFGWTANYAKYREAYDGFLEAGLQNWQNIVNNVVNRAKERFK